MGRFLSGIGSTSYYSHKTTLVNHNGTYVGVNIRRFDPNPGVLISDSKNSYLATEKSSSRDVFR